MDKNQILPASARGVADRGTTLAGAVHMLHNLRALRQKAVVWAKKRQPDHPQLRLEAARAGFGRGSPMTMRQELQKLQKLDPSAGVAIHATVLEARLLVRIGRPADAIDVLDGIKGKRPVAEAWFRTEALVDLRRFADAWPVVERLFRLVKRGNDADIKRIDWYKVYRTVDRIITKTKKYDRGIRLIGHQPPERGSEVFRLLSLLDAHLGKKDTPGAVRVMDRLMSHGLVGFHQLKACEKVYRLARLPQKAARCTEMRRKLGDLPTDKPLWPKK